MSDRTSDEQITKNAWNEYISDPRATVIEYNLIQYVVVGLINGTIVDINDVFNDNSNDIWKKIRFLSPHSCCTLEWKNKQTVILNNVKAFTKRQGYGTALMNVVYEFFKNSPCKMSIKWYSSEEGEYLYEKLPFVKNVDKENGTVSLLPYEMIF